MEGEILRLKPSVNFFVGFPLIGTALSLLGEIVYQVVINANVLERTHSAWAVAGLWVIVEIGSVVANPMVRTLVNRFSPKNRLVYLEFSRALLIATLPFLHSVVVMYVAILLISVCSALVRATTHRHTYSPMCMAPPTRLSWTCRMLWYATRIAGSMVAGVLLLREHLYTPFWFNAGFFLLSGLSLILIFPPYTLQVEDHPQHDTPLDKGTLLELLRQNGLLTVLLSLKSIMDGFALLVSSQMVFFSWESLHFNGFEYGLMFSFTGIGYLSGDLFNRTLLKRMSPLWMLGLGTVFSALGYLTYSVSQSVWWASVGLIVVGIFSSSSDGGFSKYVKNALPVASTSQIEMSIELSRRLLNVLLVLSGGMIVAWLGVRDLMVGASVMMVLTALVIAFLVLSPSNQTMLVGHSKYIK